MGWLTEVIEVSLFAAVWQHRGFPVEGPMWESWCRIRSGYGWGSLQPYFDALEAEVLELERKLN